jgi:hypothetical protein
VGTEKTTFSMKISDGNYSVQALNTITGKYSEPVSQSATGGVLQIDIDIPEGELALKILSE